MENFSWLNATIIFVTYVIIDMLYASYIIMVERRNALAAASISSVIYSLLAYGVVSYSQNILYLIPIALGAWLGTFVVVFHKRNK